MTDTVAPGANSGRMAAAISDLTVQLLRDYTGRGPTRARTHLSGDLVAVVLEDTLTQGERTLIRGGEQARVLATRHAYQHTMREELAAGVAAIVGRDVIAFMSDNHIDPDMGVEIFILAATDRTVVSETG